MIIEVNRETGVSFTVPEGGRSLVVVSGKGNAANRECRIYRKVEGNVEVLIGDCSGLDLNTGQVVEERIDSDKPVTYGITGSDDTRKPAVLAALSIKNSIPVMRRYPCRCRMFQSGMTERQMPC